VLPFLFSSTPFRSHQWHLSYRGISLSVPCQYQSVCYVAFHYTAAVTILRLSSNFSPPRSGFVAENKRQSLPTRWARSALHSGWYEFLYWRKWCDVNLLSVRVSYRSICKQQMELYKILLSRRRDWSTSRCTGADDLRKYRSACKSFCLMHVEVSAEIKQMTLSYSSSNFFVCSFFYLFIFLNFLCSLAVLIFSPFIFPSTNFFFL